MWLKALIGFVFQNNDLKNNTKQKILGYLISKNSLNK